MASEATPALWPAWMADWPIDVKAVLEREVARRPVAPEDVEHELADLMPPSFDIAEAIRRFTGAEPADRMDEPPTTFAPRVSPPAPTPAPEPLQDLAPEPGPADSPLPETEEMDALPIGEVGIEPVATILAEQVGVHLESSSEPDAAFSDLALGDEAFPAPGETRRREDDLANLYDLAREDGGAEALINPEELPDLVDELMVNEEPALPLEPSDPGQLTDYDHESSAAPPPAVEEEHRLSPASAVPSPEHDILVEAGASDGFEEFDDYDLIEEDGDEAPAADDGSQRSSAFPTPAGGVGAPGPAAGPYTEADSALNEIFGLTRPSEAPPETIDSRHAPFEDLPPLDEGDEAVDEATVVQQGPFSWDRLSPGGGSAAAQRRQEPAPAQQPTAPAIQPAFAPPPEPDDWFTAGSRPADARPGETPAASPSQADAGRASTPEDHDGQGRKRKSSFFRKLFGGGDEQK